MVPPVPGLADAQPSPAIGDLTGALPFTHVAAYHARSATVNALFRART